MESNKSRITLTVIAIALVIFGLSQCQSKDTEATTVTPVETKSTAVEKAPEAATPKPAEPASAKSQPKPAVKTEKPAPAPGLPPEHRPIF
jgi:type IV secretory pathway VirB10-like protein